MNKTQQKAQADTSAGRSLYPPQEEVVNGGLLKSSRHLFLHMATGSGKTYLAELAIEEAVADGYKAIYVTPLRALADQQYQNWKKRFLQYKVGMFTGDTLNRRVSKGSYQMSQIYVMTPERLDACMRNWRSHWDWLPDVSLVVIDEFHLLGQSQRGPRLEGTMTRLLRLNPFVRFLNLSATMPNVGELAAWLHGLSYSSQWRQVPLEKRIIRFSNAKEKPDILLAEVSRCVSAGGQSLIFCNSRSRTQSIVEYLLENGIRAACHHAGLDQKQRSAVENSFLNRELQALVATSTLEMGLNMPARQVIIYDAYIFTETGFENLPVWSYIQRSGRAGRPGLDKKGEAILLLPKWVSKWPYQYESCEEIASQLTSQKAMTEQLLVDVFSGFSRTREALAKGFLPLTLYKAQHREATIGPMVNKLILADLLIEKQDTENGGPAQLSVGLLGRLAVKLMLSPDTVGIVKRAYDTFDNLFLFDLLLLATLNEDCTPVLRVNYEEIHSLCGHVGTLPSVFMDMTVDRFKKALGCDFDTTRILSSIKMSAICFHLTEGAEIKELADTYGVYAADIHILQENTVRLLRCISLIAGALDKEDRSSEDGFADVEDHGIARLSGMLADMVEHEISSDLVALTRLRGVGGLTAKKLAEQGLTTLQDIAEAANSELEAITGIGRKRAATMIGQAKELLRNGPAAPYHEEPVTAPVFVRGVNSTIDVYRLRRSLELSVQGQDDGRFYVTGGREGHTVLFRASGYTCDCPDHASNGGHCKHILCVRLARGDAEVTKMAKRIKENKSHSIREALPSLWYSNSIMEGHDVSL